MASVSRQTPLTTTREFGIWDDLVGVAGRIAPRPTTSSPRSLQPSERSPRPLQNMTWSPGVTVRAGSSLLSMTSNWGRSGRRASPGSVAGFSTRTPRPMFTLCSSGVTLKRTDGLPLAAPFHLGSQFADQAAVMVSRTTPRRTAATASAVVRIVNTINFLKEN